MNKQKIIESNKRFYMSNDRTMTLSKMTTESFIGTLLADREQVKDNDKENT